MKRKNGGRDTLLKQNRVNNCQKWHPRPPDLFYPQVEIDLTILLPLWFKNLHIQL
jgi:hypothetical protein